MELFKALKTRSRSHKIPFKHWEIDKPLTPQALEEICKADIPDPRKDNLKYDGTRAIDGGEGVFRQGINTGGGSGEKKLSDARALRRATLANKVPYCTNMSTAQVCIEGIKSLKNREIEVMSLQDIKG